MHLAGASGLHMKNLKGKEKCSAVAVTPCTISSTSSYIFVRIKLCRFIVAIRTFGRFKVDNQRKLANHQV